MGLTDTPHETSHTSFPNTDKQSAENSYETVGIKRLNADTTCMVMPNHGPATLGSSVSEAYHRHTAFIAELQRLALALLSTPRAGQEVAYLADAQIQSLYRLGQRGMLEEPGASELATGAG